MPHLAYNHPVLAYPSHYAGYALGGLVALYAVGYYVPAANSYAGLLTLAFISVMVFDFAMTAGALKGKLKLTRDFPRILTAGRRRRGKHVIQNESRAAMLVQVHEDSYPHIDKRYKQKWQALAPGKTLESKFSFKVNKRGEIDLGGAGLRVLAGLRLWVLQYRFEWPEKVRVYPLIEEINEGDLFAHRRRLYGMGQHQSRKFGRGTEFDQLREYKPEDEFRSINWKATARAGKPIVNQYQVEQSRDLMLLIDCGRLMHTEISGRARLDHCLDAAVQLSYIALSQRDRVGMMAFDAGVHKFVAPGRRPRQLDDLIDAMFDLQPRFIESDYATAVATVKARQPKRGLVVLFTDLVDSVSSRSAVANLSRLARTHLPVVAILDDPEIDRMAESPADTTDSPYIKAAAGQSISEKQRTLSQLRTRGCIIVNVSAHRLSAAMVDQYLQVKARNLL